MSAPFNTELAMLIDRHFPAALEGDPDEIAECASLMAIALGRLLAALYLKAGADAAQRAVEAMTTQIAENACAIEEHTASGGASKPKRH